MHDIGADVFTWTKYLRMVRIGRTTRLVAFMLATYADPDGTNIFPGVARLAVGCELDHKTVKKALATLLAAGLIEKVTGRTGMRGRNEGYRLILHPDVIDRAGALSPTEFENEVERVSNANRRSRGTGAQSPRTPAEVQGQKVPVPTPEEDQVQGRSYPVPGDPEEEVRGNSRPQSDEVRGNSRPQYGVNGSAIPIPLPEPSSTSPSDEMKVSGPLTLRAHEAAQDPIESEVDDDDRPYDRRALLARFAAARSSVHARAAPRINPIAEAVGHRAARLFASPAEGATT